MSIMDPAAKTAEEVARNLRKMGEAGVEMVEQALYQRGQELMRMMKPLTPLRDGALRRSAYGILPRREKGGVVVEVGFDGRSAPYALFVHEMPTSTNWSEPGTGPKFLERPFDELSKRLASDVANDIAAMMRRNRVPKGY